MRRSGNRAEAAGMTQQSLTALGLLALAVVSVGCGGVPSLETAERFQRVEAAYAAAESPDDFARVAAQYEELRESGFVSGTVLYNQGNAWMRAGEEGRAIACWRQARRARPRDPYLAANLQSALTACGSSAGVTPDHGVAGYVFFWQDWLSYREKFLLTTLLLIIAAVTGLMSQLVPQKRLLRRLTMLAGALCVVAGASVLWEWNQTENTVHGVVVVETIEARKGNSESYEAAFSRPLREGAEFTVVEQRADWLNIHIEDLGAAWVPSRTVVTF